MKIKKTLTFDIKLKILDCLKRNVSTKTISKKFQIHKSTISRIKKNKDKICDFAKQTNVPVTAIKRISNVAVPETERALNEWFINERVNQNVVTDKIFQLKALEFHKKLNPTVTFEASQGWLQKFKKRHSIRILRVCGEKVSTNEAADHEFIPNFLKLLQNKNLVPHQIYNAAECELAYKFLSNSNLISQNEIENSKEKITIMPCTNANGQHKLPLMIVGETKSPHSFENVNLPKMHYRFSKNGLQTRQLFREWFFNVFVPQVKKYLISKNLPQKAVLLLDSTTEHCNEEELRTEDGNIIVQYFPANNTAILKPFDQNIFKTIKQIYRRKLLLNLISKSGKNLNDRLNEINLKEVVFLITEAWNDVSTSLITNGFKELIKLRTDSNSFVEFGDIFDDESEIPLSHLYRQIVPNTNLKEDETTHWVCGMNENNGNLITKEDTSDDDENHSNSDEKNSNNTIRPGPNVNKVIESLNITIEYAENNLSIKEILFLRKIREKVISSTISDT